MAINRKKHNINKKFSVDKRVYNKSIAPATTDYKKTTSNGIPILSDRDVEIAKEFIAENEK
jgi:hypothetical protein